jgi:hypothetical protein
MWTTLFFDLRPFSFMDVVNVPYFDVGVGLVLSNDLVS